jgi:S1-C subfamily serine protease
VRGATVLISLHDADGTGVKSGTGFHIGNGRYVTAAHVIQDERGNAYPNIYILSAKTGTTKVATIVAEGSFDLDGVQDRDIAELQSSPLEDELAWRAPSDNDIDRDFRAIGYPWSQEFGDTSAIPEPIITRGTLLNMVTQDGVEIVQSSVQIQKGNSGGPLVDECGTAIAILSSASIRPIGDGGHIFEGYPIFISMTELSRVQ